MNTLTSSNTNHTPSLESNHISRLTLDYSFKMILDERIVGNSENPEGKVDKDTMESFNNDAMMCQVFLSKCG